MNPSAEQLREQYKDSDPFWMDWVYDHTPSPGEYSMVVIPDVQELTAIYPEKLNRLMDWIVANKDKENIRFVIDVGDVTWNGHAMNTVEYQTAADAFQKLRSAGIEYSVCYGNHDYTPGNGRDTRLFNQYFPWSVLSGFDSYGGTMTPNNSENTYFCFEAAGNRYLVVSLEISPEPNTVAWANEVIARHPHHQTIIVTHQYLSNQYGQYAPNGQALWNDLVSQHPNVILVICGHDRMAHDPGSLNYRADRGVHGNVVHQIMANSQDVDGTRGGVGLLLMLRFRDGGKTVDLNYFSPVHHDLAFKQQNQFTIGW
ncbi:MAG: metallophosphoesterase [Clostridia bacterium]|nr:metallophosphoesterase [Clostridia bacterium]